MGKPMMIHERDCDVGDLTLEDFVDGEPPETSYFMIELIKFAKLGTCIALCHGAGKRYVFLTISHLSHGNRPL